MPIYEYECAKCGVFEVSQRITEQPLRRCPTCKGKVSKLISSTSFALKGTGWYATDYANKGKSPETKSSEGSSPGKDDSSGASSDSSSSDAKSSTTESKSSSTDTKGSRTPKSDASAA